MQYVSGNSAAVYTSFNRCYVSDTEKVHTPVLLYEEPLSFGCPIRNNWRIRIFMNITDVSHIRNGCLEVDILVSPRSNRSGPEGFDEWRRRLIVRVKAPPLDGRANKEVEEIFREITGCSSKVTSGHLNRQKTVTVTGDTDIILEKLEDSNESERTS